METDETMQLDMLINQIQICNVYIKTSQILDPFTLGRGESKSVKVRFASPFFEWNNEASRGEYWQI